MKREAELLSRYLDGEIGAEQLSPELRAEAARFERLVAALDRPAGRMPPGLKAAVMRRVREERVRPWRALIGRRPLVAGLALAATVALALLGPWARTERDGATGAVAIRFLYVAPQASRVAVTGDFAAWDPGGIPLERRPGGVWATEIALAPGLHHYVFIVDGTEWRPDPNVPSRVDDGFGRENSVLLVTGGRAT